MDLQGKILEIFETVQINDSFKKREFIVEYADNPNYPELIKFELTQDRCDLLNDFKVNEEVEVWFNIKGRKWTDPQGEDKYFNSLQAWKIQPNQSSEISEDPSKDLKEPEWLSNNPDEEDDLPF